MQDIVTRRIFIVPTGKIFQSSIEFAEYKMLKDTTFNYQMAIILLAWLHFADPYQQCLILLLNHQLCGEANFTHVYQKSG